MTTDPEQRPPAQPGLLSLRVRARGRTTMIELEGEWDLVGTPAVRQAVDRVLGERPESVVLDLSGLSFLDSSGLHGTVGIHRHCSAHGSRLVIIPGPPAVQRPFQICGLEKVLPFASVMPEIEQMLDRQRAVAG